MLKKVLKRLKSNYFADKKLSWQQKWNTQKHTSSKKEIFQQIDSYLESPPKTILDIGCGYAKESGFFYEKYNTSLFLLDGDPKNNKTNQERDIGFGKAEDFKFYTDIESLKRVYDSRNMKYTFIDASMPKIPDIKFDLIYSLLSCGFHYPITDYINLIKEHSDENTIVIIDVRKETFTQQSKFFKVINVIAEYKKHYKMHIQLK